MLFYENVSFKEKGGYPWFTVMHMYIMHKVTIMESDTYIFVKMNDSS